ncbi:Abi family protein [Clostridium porci]|uniref:Abi family protein n=1 Tax=Clostridium porci TaxID=2605778 RepID=UPI003A8FA30F
MANSQAFTTIDEQIELLKRRHLEFNDVCTAKPLLDNYGYYNIINGYKDPYVYTKDGQEFYKDGITFEQIYSLFHLDHAISHQIMTTLLDLEDHLKAVTAYVISEAFGSEQKDYLRFNNYQNRRSSAKQFTLSAILESLNKTSMSNKNPIKHHREVYGNVPPWVLFKGVYLSTIINFIKLQKPKQKEAIIRHFYPISEEQMNPYIRDIFMDTLFISLEYRNLAAHGGRIYNYVPDSTVRITDKSKEALGDIITNYSSIESAHSLGTLVLLYDLFKKKSYRDDLRKIIHSNVTAHCRKYPDDMEYLMKSIGIDHIAHPVHK